MGIFAGLDESLDVLREIQWGHIPSHRPDMSARHSTAEVGEDAIAHRPHGRIGDLEIGGSPITDQLCGAEVAGIRMRAKKKRKWSVLGRGKVGGDGSWRFVAPPAAGEAKDAVPVRQNTAESALKTLTCKRVRDARSNGQSSCWLVRRSNCKRSFASQRSE